MIPSQHFPDLLLEIDRYLIHSSLCAEKSMKQTGAVALGRKCIIFDAPGVGKSHLINRLNAMHNPSAFMLMRTKEKSKACQDGTLTCSTHGDFIDLVV